MRTKLLFVLAFLLPTSLAWGQSGRIAGRVTDASTGEPLPGVNVVIDGTTQGATTDVDGYYSIINVRPGTYNLRASFVGYTPGIVENVNVDIDLTSEVDFALQEETVGMNEVIVSATRPIIQRDISGSQRNIDADEITAAPYQSVANVLTSGVSVNDISSVEDRPEIRGSSFSESLFMVDGVNQGDVLTNNPHFQVNLDAVEEIKVETGGFNAEYGNVRSGVINVVTKEGGERISGSINFQYSAPAQKNIGPSLFGFDSPLVIPFVDPAAGAFEGGNDFFNGWVAEANSLADGAAHKGMPGELYAKWLWHHRSQDAIDELKRIAERGYVEANGTQYPVNVAFKDGIDPDDMVFHQNAVLPDYRASFTLGGPVPLTPVRFFVSYDRNMKEYFYRYPQRAYEDNNLRGKLTTNIGSGIKVQLHGYYSTQSGGDGGQGPGIGGFVSSNPFTQGDASNKFWYPHCAVPGTRTRQIYGAQWTHTLNANTFYELNLLHDRVDYKMDFEMRNTAPIPGSARAGGDPNNPADWVRSSSGTSGSGVDEGRIGTEAEAEARRAAGQQGWENWRDWALVQIGGHWYDEAPKGYGPVNWRDITGEYRMESCNLRADNTFTRGYEFNGAVTSQLNRTNQLKAGFEVRRDEIDMYYEAIDPSVNGGSVYDSRVTPWRGAFYAQNKLEFQGFVANIGLRADWMVTGEFPAVLDDCNLRDPESCLGDDGPYSQFLLPGKTTEDVPGGRVLGIKETTIPKNIPTTRLAHTRLSPRVGISYPITTVAKVFFNYGHFYQWPDALQMYRLQLSTPNGYRVSEMGNPLLEPMRTIMYEAGYEHNLFNTMNLRLTGYYKDINKEVSNVEIRPLAYGGGAYNTWLNMEFRDVRGFESFLELRRGIVPYLSGWVSLNYLVESGASYGYDNFFEDPSRLAELADTEVSNPDVRPIIKANVNFVTPSNWIGPQLGETSLLGGLSISVLYTWRRGSSFTWNPAEFPLVEDNMRWRPYQRFDLRLNKTLFSSGRFETTFYLDVVNLFNTKNMTVFDDFGSAGDPTTDDQDWAWDGHRWWNNQKLHYLESLGYSAENQNRDGTFNNTIGRPGDYKDERIDLPDFSPMLFLEARDIFFGIKVYF